MKFRFCFSENIDLEWVIGYIDILDLSGVSWSFGRFNVPIQHALVRVKFSMVILFCW